MKIHSLFLGALASGMILASCGGTSADAGGAATAQGDTGQVAGPDAALLIGSWKDQSPSALHFTLLAGGAARSDNMATLLYQHWYVKGDQLSLVAKSIGNGTSSTDTTTYTVERLNERELVLRRADQLLTFTRAAGGSNGDRPEGQAMVLEGRLTLGHEARSFTPCGSDSTYWVSDLTGTLGERYAELTAGKAPYTPIHVEMKVVDRGRSQEGFAAGYAGVYEVQEILAAKNISANDCK